jgi:hypothetical protein
MRETPRSFSMMPLVTIAAISALVAACGGATSKPSTASDAKAGAAGGAPVTLSVGVGKDGAPNTVTIKSAAAKKITQVCYSAPFEKNGQPRLFFWCDDVELAPGASSEVVACSSCSTELPQFASVTLERVTLEGGGRWFRHATASKPANGAPLVARAIGRHDWDESHAEGTLPLYEVVNVSDHPVAWFQYTCKKAGGGQSGGSVTPNDPIEPGETAYFSDADAECRITGAGSDNGDWREEEK